MKTCCAFGTEAELISAYLSLPITWWISLISERSIEMSRLYVYWFAWILAAVAFWLSVGWFGIGALFVDPYFDRQVDGIAAAVAPGAPSKENVAEIERSRSSTFKAIGFLGGVLCGFAFGVAGSRFNRQRTKPETDR